MRDEDDIDGLAAEYVLGSLTAAERAEVNARRRSHPALNEAILAWERRLGPLSEALPGIEPPSHLLAGIGTRLWGAKVGTIEPASIASVHRSMRRWRAVAVGASAVCACLILIAGWLFHNSRSIGIPAKLVAELQRSASAAAATNPTVALGFVVHLDLRASTMIVSPFAVPPGSTQDYQLWLVPRESAPPISLGVIPLAERTTSPWFATYPPYDLVDATLTVSLEPAGGSPKGIPTGPTMFTGKLMQAMP